jgi:GDP-L-fucose synthase
MLASAIVRRLLAQGQPSERIISRNHTELDLTNQAATNRFFESEKAGQVYLAAAKVWGINANKAYPELYPVSLAQPISMQLKERLLT